MPDSSRFPRALTALAAATLIVAGTTPGASAAQLIVNGNFESGPNPGSFTTLRGGDRTIPGWTVTGVSVDYIGTYWRGADGGRSIDLDGTPGPGGIMQIIATRPGATYVLAFMLSGNGDCAPDIKRMQVSAGSVARNYSVNVNTVSVSKRRWLQRSFSFRAAGTQTRIWLRSLDPPTNCGPVVDDVSVSGPPGPRIPVPVRTMSIAPPPGPSAAGPCYVNAGALAAIAKPCFGPPSSTITVIQERPTPAGLTLLFTANLTFSTAGAVSTPLSAFSGGIATATAPAALCAGSSPHKWNVWLVDATGTSQGVIGDYTMTGCP
jgi:choice-of-anchor C domain-containing protein